MIIDSDDGIINLLIMDPPFKLGEAIGARPLAGGAGPTRGACRCITS